MLSGEWRIMSLLVSILLGVVARMGVQFSLVPGWFHWVCRMKMEDSLQGASVNLHLLTPAMKVFQSSAQKIKIRYLRCIPSLFFRHCQPHPGIFGPRIVTISPPNFPRPKRTLRSSGSLFVKPLSWAVHVLSCWGKVTGRCAGFFSEGSGEGLRGSMFAKVLWMGYIYIHDLWIYIYIHHVLIWYI